MYIWVYVYIYMCIYMYVYMHIYMYIYTYVYVHTWLSISIYVYTYTNTMYVCIYTVVFGVVEISSYHSIYSTILYHHSRKQPQKWPHWYSFDLKCNESIGMQIENHLQQQPLRDGPASKPTSDSRGRDELSGQLTPTGRYLQMSALRSFCMANRVACWLATTSFSSVHRLGVLVIDQYAKEKDKVRKMWHRRLKNLLKVLKSQLAHQSTIQNEYKAIIWEYLPAGTCW